MLGVKEEVWFENDPSMIDIEFNTGPSQIVLGRFLPD